MKDAKLERSIEEIICNLLQGAESYFTYKNRKYWVSKFGRDNYSIEFDDKESKVQTFYSVSDLINYLKINNEDFLDVFNEIEFDLGGMFIRDKYAYDEIAYIDINIEKMIEIIEAYKSIKIKFQEFSAIISKKEDCVYYLLQLLPITEYNRHQFCSIKDMLKEFEVQKRTLCEIWEEIIIEEIY